MSEVRKVYVMDDGEYRKIGFSKHPAARAEQVQRENTFQRENKVRVVFELETDNYYGVERAAHLAVRENRVVGEWFDISVEDAIEAVKYAMENPLDAPVHSTSKAKEEFNQFMIDGDFSNRDIADKFNELTGGSTTPGYISNIRIGKQALPKTIMLLVAYMKQEREFEAAKVLLKEKLK